MRLPPLIIGTIEIEPTSSRVHKVLHWSLALSHLNIATPLGAGRVMPLSMVT
ncbi:hypothetical protein D9M71_786960 [compost metagenome]